MRRAHRALGLALALPILLWAATGLLFHLKPGWEGAYAALSLPLEPLGEATPFASPADPSWLETRRLRTVLGEHLLVRTPAGWQHLDPRTLASLPEPAPEVLRPLIERAVAADAARDGRVTGHADGAFTTETGARVELDWSTLRLSQRAADTDRIDLLYRIHYLQWTGIAAIDRPFALLGLAALALLALAGLRLARRG